MLPLVFTGNANIPLAQAIAKEMDVSLSDAEIIRFADSECRVRVETSVADRDVFVVQSLCNPVDENLMEFLFLCDAIRREEAKKIIAVLPYHGYARQDRVHRPGECLSAQVVAKLIEAVHVDKLLTVDLHSEAIMGFFKIPVTHISALPIFHPLVQSLQGDVVIVSPDAGAMKRAQHFAEGVDAPLAFIEKKRDLNKTHTIASMKVIGDVQKKTAIIVDDVIVTGGTLVNAAHMLKQMGASRVIALATHADLVGGSDKILEDSPLDAIWVGDTIGVSDDQQFSKLEIVSTASLIADGMKKMIRV